MATPNNTYEILYNCYTGTTEAQLSLATNTYKVLNSVYDDTNKALKIQLVTPVTINEDTTFSQNVSIAGNLTVSGATISSIDLNVIDNIITLNSGETGAGVSEGTAGLKIDRGSAADVYFLWDESVTGWTIANNFVVTGTTNLYGLLEAGAGANISGEVNITGGTYVWNSFEALQGSTQNEWIVGDYLHVNGNVTITGVTQLYDELNGTHINLTGTLDVEDIVNVTGNTYLWGDLEVGGNVTATTFIGDLVGDLDWTYIQNTPTTISGYGITDAYTKTETDANFLSAVTNIEALANVDTTGVAADNILIYDGANWVDTAVTFFAITSPSAGDMVRYDGADWVNVNVDGNWLSATTTAGDLNAYTTTEADANFLSANTSYYTEAQADANFLSATTSYYTEAQADANFLSATTTYDLDDLTDVTVSSEAQAQWIIYTGGTWQNADMYEQIDFQFEFNTATTYYLVPNAYYEVELLDAYLFTDTGQVDVYLWNEGVVVGGVSGATIHSGTTTHDLTTDVDVVLGNTITFTLENDSNDATTVYGSIKTKRI